MLLKRWKERRLARKERKLQRKLERELQEKNRRLAEAKRAIEELIERDRKKKIRREEIAIAKGLRDKDKTVCVVGERPKYLKWMYDETSSLYKKLVKEIENNLSVLYLMGYRNFMTGMSLGVETLFAEAVLKMKRKKKVNLICIIACRDQHKKWKRADKERYYRIVNQADEAKVLFEEYSPECYLLRSKYMVDNSKQLEAYWSGVEKGAVYYTMNYAKSVNVHCHRNYLTDVGRDLSHLFVGAENL